MEFPNKKYKVIYADPPWKYRNVRTGGSMISGSSAKYSVMSTADICALPVKEIAEKDSVLFLWATVPMIEDAFEVLYAWGFMFKTMLTWRKIMSLGMGYWFRGQCEHLLFGVRGDVKAFRCQEPNFIQTKALRHSEKPEEFRALIERATKGMEPKIELFARRKVRGWTAFGDEVEEVEGSDIIFGE